LSDIFKKYSLIDFSGNGIVIFDVDTDNSATFQIYQLNQGNVAGSLLFKKIDSSRGEVGSQIPPDDLKLLLEKLSDINRRSYRKKAEGLLDSLGVLDDNTRKLLKEIIPIRDRIIRSGRFVDLQTSERLLNNILN
jgi:hypothetical protein